MAGFSSRLIMPRFHFVTHLQAGHGMREECQPQIPFSPPPQKKKKKKKKKNLENTPPPKKKTNKNREPENSPLPP